MSTLKTKRRAIYSYECVRCGEKRSSLIYSRAVDGVCRLCRASENNENQGSLFSVYTRGNAFTVHDIVDRNKCEECGGSGEVFIPAGVIGGEIQDEETKKCFKCKGSGIVEPDEKE